MGESWPYLREVTMTAVPVCYAILGQRKLKMHELVKTRQHNSREEEVGNAEPDGPPPLVVFGEPDTYRAVRARLDELGIKPRRGAVVALELMIDVSKAWWVSKDRGVEALQRLAIERQVRAYLADRYPDPRCVVSMMWHLDETTNHLHVITVPARLRVDRRRREAVDVWSLSARGDLLPKMVQADREAAYETACRAGMGGRGQMAREQTIFAGFMEPLKLERGKVWSGTPNKPNSVYQAEMTAAISAHEASREEHDRARGDYEERLLATAEAMEEFARTKTELEARAADLDRRERMLADWEARVAANAAAVQERADKATAWEAEARRRERSLTDREAGVAIREERTAHAMRRLSGVLTDADVVASAIAAMGEKGARFRSVEDVIRRLGSVVGDAGMRDAAFARDLRQARSAGLL